MSIIWNEIFVKVEEQDIIRNTTISPKTVVTLCDLAVDVNLLSDISIIDMRPWREYCIYINIAQ